MNKRPIGSRQSLTKHKSNAMEAVRHRWRRSVPETLRHRCRIVQTLRHYNLVPNFLGAEVFWGRSPPGAKCPESLNDTKWQHKKIRSDWLFLQRKKRGRRSIVTYNLPHPSPMFHFMVPIVCLLSDYLSNSLSVHLDRRFGPPRPTNPREWFLIVTLM